MKKILALTLMYAAFNMAYAAPIGPADAPKANTIDAVACPMVDAASPLTFTASKGVGVGYNCITTGAAVNAGNVKGKFTYGGTTSGNGGVLGCAGSKADTSVGYSVAAPDVTKDGCS